MESSQLWSSTLTITPTPPFFVPAATSVIGCLEYGNLSKLLEGAELQKDSKNHSVKLVSPVVSVFHGIANTDNLKEPIRLQLNFSETVRRGAG